MQIIQIDPAKIVIGERLRAVDGDYVQQLAQSISQTGLNAPIRVTMADEAGVHRLIAGAHRLSAVLALGLTTISAIPFEGTEDEADLLEAEENLIRRELSELDRAGHLATHKRLWLKLYPATQHGGDRRKKQVANVGDLIDHPLSKRYSAAAAKKLGWAERTIQRAILRYEALSGATRVRLSGTWLANNGSALDALIGPVSNKRAEAEVHALLDLLLGKDGPRSVAEAERRLKRLPPPCEQDAIRARLFAIWGDKATVAVKREFLKFLLAPIEGQPSFDRLLVEEVLAELAAEKAAREAAILAAVIAGRAA